MQLIIRFLIGGTVVALFALIGDIVRPRSFAGIFGAAPSVALGTLALTVQSEGAAYAGIEARSMIVGATATLFYAWISSRVMWKGNATVLVVALAGLALWLAVSIGGWFLLLRDKP